MSVEAAEAGREGFSARSVIALILVGLVAFAGFGVLGVYAPELRGHSDPGAHALSSSPVGFRGAVLMLRELGQTVEIGHGAEDPGRTERAVVVLTPQEGDDAVELAEKLSAHRILIILPKWRAAPDPLHPGRLAKLGFIEDFDWAAKMFAPFAADTRIAHDAGAIRPVLTGFGQRWTAGGIENLQHISGPGWNPVIVDQYGRTVLAQAKQRPLLYVLSEPDLLNNQGVADLGNARVGLSVVQALAGPDGVVFDVSLNGFGGQRSLGRLMLEPPWVAATICVLAAALLMGLHALARFGPPAREGRAIALGASALVENSAGLIRLAGREPALAPDYLRLTEGLIAEAAGGGQDEDWLERMAQRRGLAAPQALADEAARTRTREELMAFAARLHQWRQEMMRDGR